MKAQRYGSAVFTTAQIDSGSLDPPFGIEILGYFRKGIETKYLIILYVYISGCAKHFRLPRERNMMSITMLSLAFMLQKYTILCNVVASC